MVKVPSSVLGEIGAWAVPKKKPPVLPLPQPGQGVLGEIGAWATPKPKPLPLPLPQPPPGTLGEIGSWATPGQGGTSETGAWPSMGNFGEQQADIDLAIAEGRDFGTATNNGKGDNYVAPPPTTRTVPGHMFMPDWEALIRGDPRMLAGQTAWTTAKGSAATRRANAIKNAIIHFGAAPQNWQSGYGDLTEADYLAASDRTANPFSFMALAEAQRGRNRGDLRAELAGRGMLDSGALTGGENMIQRGYEEGVGAETSNLLDTLSGYESGYANDIGTLDRNWIDTQAQIASGVQAANPAQWIDQYEEPI
jgi:hypothetical protein